MITHLAQILGELGVPGQLPGDPAPKPPPGGADRVITDIVGMLKWAAGLGVLAAFFGGLATFTGGRVLDHQRLGRVGTMMMVASLGGAILFGVGYALLSSLATGG